MSTDVLYVFFSRSALTDVFGNNEKKSKTTSMHRLPRPRRDKRDLDEILGEMREISSRLQRSRRELGEICNVSKIAAR